MAEGSNHIEVDFGSGDVKRIGAQRVYIRPPGETEWELRADLYCTQVAFAVSPSMPNATLQRFYGSVRDIGEIATDNRERIDLTDYLVRIQVELATDFPNDELGPPSLLTFYGIIGSAIDNHAGLLNEALPSGVQTFSAFGLEQLLRNTVISIARTINIAGDEREISTGLTFNEGGKPNMSPNENATSDYYAFANDPDYDEEADPAPDPPLLRYWSPLEILRYVVSNHAPEDGLGNPIMQLALGTTTILEEATRLIPDDTRPVIAADGLSVYDLVSVLLDRASLLCWSLTITETDGELTGTIVAHSLTSTTGLPVRNSPNTIDIITDADPLTTLSIEDSAIERVDQVIIRGPKKVFVFSTRLDSEESESLKPLERDWDDTDSTLYSNPPTFTGGEDQQMRKANEYRDKEDLRKVFSLFRIGRKWNGRTVDPAAVSQIAIADGAGVLYTPFRGAVRILPTIPFAKEDAKPLEAPRRNPLLVTLRPNETIKYISNDQMQSMLDVGDIDDDDSSRLTMEAVADGDRNLRIVIGGEPRHAIAGDEFTPQAYDRPYPKYDYKKIWITLAVETELWVERRYPEDVTSIVDRDVRQKIISLGERDEFQVIRVASGTIKGVDDSGALEYATAELLKDGAADDTAFDKIGQILKEFYTVDRRKVSLYTRRIGADVMPGKLILSVSKTYDVDNPMTPGVDIIANAIISEVTIDMPMQLAADGEAPLIRISTYTPDDVDPITIGEGLVLGESQRTRGLAGLNAVAGKA